VIRYVILGAAFLLGAVAQADERILSFDSRIHIAADSSLEVTETIRVRAEHERIRRGIYREFPTTYFRRDGSRVTVGFDVLSVRRNGLEEPYHLERRSNGVVVYIGQKDRMVSRGEHLYELRYRTDRQLGFFSDHDELYWNVTGVDWAFPIDVATAEVALPSGVPTDAVGLEGYTGAMGDKGKNYSARMDGNEARFETKFALPPRHGITIVVAWPKGFVVPPSGIDRLAYFLRDNRPVCYGLIGLAVLLGYYLFIWRRVGRDPVGGAIIPRYTPPETESPASMRYLMQMRYDNRCFVAGILSLAVKGYLSITQEAGHLFKKGKYILQRESGSQTPLAPDEHKLLSTLLGGIDTLELDDKNHAILQSAKRAHEAQLKSKYVTSFFDINGGWHLLGIALSLAAIGLAVAAQAVWGGYGIEWFILTPGGWSTLAIGVTGLVANGVFGRLLKAPTTIGRKRMDEIEGFKLYLSVAEDDELKLAAAPRRTPGLFETYLPFALALGVEQPWSEKFAAVFLTQAAAYSPAWYRGDRWDVNDLSGFSSSLSSSFDSAVSSASTPPGSSSGSGGGGSSGGGGGGGGGGGW